jgi:hypothetical protein
LQLKLIHMQFFMIKHRRALPHKAEALAGIAAISRLIRKRRRFS